jgi:hypothetical protein
MPSLATVAAAAAVVASASAAGNCQIPAVGVNVTLWPCNTPGAAVAWTWNSPNPSTGFGQFSLRQNEKDAGLCLAAGGPIYPPSESPMVVLAACDFSNPATVWAPNFINAQPTSFFSTLTGESLDAFNNQVTPGTQLETFNLNGGANQLYSYASTTGYLLSNLTANFCVAVC